MTLLKKSDDTTTHVKLKIEMKESQLSEAYQEYYKENIDLYDKLDMTKILKQKEKCFSITPRDL